MKHLFDIFEINKELHIVIKIERPSKKIETMPLKDYIMKNTVIRFDNSYMTIEELVNSETIRMVNSRQNSLFVEVKMMKNIKEYLEKRLSHAEQRLNEVIKNQGNAPHERFTYWGGEEMGYWKGRKAAYENILDEISN